MSKVIAFGCSFTKYHWPTWADIILKQAELDGLETDNWGMPGAGNTAIALRIHEAIASGLLKAGDHALVCWSTHIREDRVVGSTWISPGDIFTQSTYSSEFVEKFTDLLFYVYRDAALIKSTQQLLSNAGIHQLHISLRTYLSISAKNWEYQGKNIDPSLIEEYQLGKRVLDFFDVKFDAVPIADIVQCPSPTNILVKRYNQPTPHADPHPLPADYLHYINTTSLLEGTRLSTIGDEVTEWVRQQQAKIDNAVKPLQISNYPIPRQRFKSYGVIEFDPVTDWKKYT